MNQRKESRGCTDNKNAMIRNMLALNVSLGHFPASEAKSILSSKFGFFSNSSILTVAERRPSNTSFHCICIIVFDYFVLRHLYVYDEMP
mmetsp:Transcript_39321/g.39821  ORF Transcript_39321/g.39821 Transcript_39321/m.39821 type:complete len:89 (+) Transcript_39321:399-665(+)